MVWVSAVVCPGVNRLSTSRFSVTSIIEWIAPVSSSEYASIRTPSRVALLKTRTTSPMGSS